MGVSKAKASGGSDLFDFRESSWSDLSNWWDKGPVGALKA